MNDKTEPFYLCLFSGEGAPEPFCATDLKAIKSFLEGDLGGRYLRQQILLTGGFIAVYWCDNIGEEHRINCYLQDFIHGL